MAEQDTKRPLFSDALVQFFKRRMTELVGLAVLAGGGLLSVILLTARDSDPSSHASSDGPVQNWLGAPGAEIAAQLLQWVGLASLLIALTLVIWGWSLLRHRPVSSWRLRLLAWPVSIWWLATGMAGLASSFGANLPGVIGHWTISMFLPLTDSLVLLPMLPPDRLLGLVFCLAGLALYLWASAFSRSEWVLLRGLFARAAKPFQLLAAGLLARKGRARPEPDQKPAKAAKKKARKKQPRREPQLMGEAAAAAPAKKSRPAGKTAQKSFDFDSRQGFRLPETGLLKAAGKAARGPAQSVLDANAAELEKVLADFRIQGEITDARFGPVVTRYDLEPAPGTKSQRVIALADDIARSMSAMAVRVAVVPGQNVIGIELPNADRQTVLLRELLEDTGWTDHKGDLPVSLGKDIAGGPVIVDLARMPHLLVAGTTGSGKSVGINAMILSLLYRHTPETCRLIMIDPKMLELSVYDGIPHLLTPVVTEPAKAVMALKWAVREMESRYRNLAKLGVRNITGYNQRLAEARAKGEVLNRRVQTGFDEETGKPIFEEEILDLAPLPYIVVVIDEVADLMMVAGKEIEAAVQRLAQMARAAGIHVIMATQRPSVDVITGTIKANFPTRISFQVTSRIDSRTILNEQGAEQLLGRGDMLYMEGGGRIMRVHGPFVDDSEVELVANFLRAQGEPEYDEQVTEEAEEGGDLAGGAGGQALPTGDSLYDQAVQLVVREQRASTSFVQRHLKIGYNRAATLIEEMEQAGVISQANHVGKREVLIQDD